MEKEAESAYRKALNILERRDYTQAELQNKLKDKGFTSETIAAVVERLKDYGLINDRRFAEQYLRYHYLEKSKRVLSMKLLQKGIHPEIFESVYEELKEELDGEPEQEALRQAVKAALRKAERKGCLVNELSGDERNRIVASLYRKGFSVAKIQTELNKAVELF